MSKTAIILVGALTDQIGIVEVLPNKSENARINIKGNVYKFKEGEFKTPSVDEIMKHFIPNSKIKSIEEIDGDTVIEFVPENGYYSYQLRVFPDGTREIRDPHGDLMHN